MPLGIPDPVTWSQWLGTLTPSPSEPAYCQRTSQCTWLREDRLQLILRVLLSLRGKLHTAAFSSALQTTVPFLSFVARNTNSVHKEAAFTYFLKNIPWAGGWRGAAKFVKNLNWFPRGLLSKAVCYVFSVALQKQPPAPGLCPCCGLTLSPLQSPFPASRLRKSSVSEDQAMRRARGRPASVSRSWHVYNGSRTDLTAHLTIDWNLGS